jgi:hypothetical protein
MTTKLEKQYEKIKTELKKYTKEKNTTMQNGANISKLSLDAQFMNSETMGLYRSFFTFTHCLIISVSDRLNLKDVSFEDIESFTRCFNPKLDEELPMDFMILP